MQWTVYIFGFTHHYPQQKFEREGLINVHRIKISTAWFPNLHQQDACTFTTLQAKKKRQKGHKVFDVWINGGKFLQAI